MAAKKNKCEKLSPQIGPSACNKGTTLGGMHVLAKNRSIEIEMKIQKSKNEIKIVIAR